jgi:hypothetical protein
VNHIHLPYIDNLRFLIFHFKMSVFSRGFKQKFNKKKRDDCIWLRVSVRKWIYPGPGFGGARPNDVLCVICSVLLCVLEQPRVDNPSVGPIGSNWSTWLKAGLVYTIHTKISYNFLQGFQYVELLKWSWRCHNFVWPLAKQPKHGYIYLTLSRQIITLYNFTLIT